MNGWKWKEMPDKNAVFFWEKPKTSASFTLDHPTIVRSNLVNWPAISYGGPNGPEPDLGWVAAIFAVTYFIWLPTISAPEISKSPHVETFPCWNVHLPECLQGQTMHVPKCSRDETSVPKWLLPKSQVSKWWEAFQFDPIKSKLIILHERNLFIHTTNEWNFANFRVLIFSLV